MDMILSEYKTTLQAVAKTKGYWNRDTGVYMEDLSIVEDFTGAVLPLSQDDFIKRPDGGYTREDRKLYTSKNLANNQTVIWLGYNWRIQSDLEYDYIDVDFNRYYMRRIGDTSD